MADNLFSDVAADIQSDAAKPARPNIFSDVADAIREGRPMEQQTGALEATGVHAAMGAVPALGVLGGAELGAEAGAAVGSLVPGPGTLVGGLVGGLGGGFLGGYLGGKAQDTAIEALPNSWKDPLLQEVQTTEKEHPYASMLGGLVPYMVTMTPFSDPSKALKAKTALGRVLANPATARVFGGVLQGGLELSNEYWSNETPDWAKIGIATGFGIVFNRPNGIGEMIGKGVRAPFSILPEITERTPSMANAEAAGLVGAGATESVADGAMKRPDATEQEAQQKARDEQSVLGPKPPSDLHASVERSRPELIARRNELHDQLSDLRNSIFSQGVVIDPEGPAAKHINALEAELSDISAKLRGAYRGAGEAAGAETVDEAAKAAEEGPKPPAGAEPVTRDQMYNGIASDVANHLVALGVPQDQAEARGQLEAAFFDTLSARAKGSFGTSEELYRQHGTDWEGKGYFGGALRGAPSLLDFLRGPAPEGAAPAAEAEAADALSQSSKGNIKGALPFKPERRPLTTLFKDADFSTLIHEGAHNYLAILAHYAERAEAPQGLVDDWQTIKDWLKVNDASELGRPEHEKFAKTFETYAREGVAPSARLARAFAAFKQWLVTIYNEIKGRVFVSADGVRIPRNIPDGIRETFDRMLAEHPEPTVISLEAHPRGPTLSDIHQADAAEAPAGPAAEATMDRVIAEATRREQEHEPTRKIAEAAGTEKTPIGFKTAKGSTYEVHNDGTTTRNKAERNEAGHEGDFGPKPRTERTIYVNAKMASALSAAGLTSPEGTQYRVALRDGRASLVWRFKPTDRWGTGEFGKYEPFSDQPEVGKAPLELWGKKDDVEGHEAYSGMHAGNAITEVHYAEPVEKQAAGQAANASGEAPARPPEAGLLAKGSGGSEAATGGGSGSGEHGAQLGRGGEAGGEGPAPAAGAAAERPVAGQPARAGAAAVPHPEPRDELPRTDPRDVDDNGNINLRRINAPDDVIRVIRATGEANDYFIGDRRGVVTWEETVGVAKALGMDATRLLMRKLGQAFNASEAWAARQLLIQSAYATHASMRAAADGDAKALLAYVQAREKHKMIQAQVSGMTAEAGRALNIFRKVVGGEGDMVEAIDKIVRDGAGITLEQARREAKLGAVLETPEQISQFMQATRKPSFGAMLEEYWINNLISGISTHVTYSIANGFLALQRNVPETLVASLIGRVRASMGRTGTRVRPGEAIENVKTMFGTGARAGGQAAFESLKAGTTLRLPGEKGAIGQMGMGGAGAPLVNAPTLAPDAFGVVRGTGEGFVTGAALMQAAGDPGAPRWGVGHSNLGANPDIFVGGKNVLPLGTIIRLPSRAIAGIHSFFRVSTYLTSINAWAMRTALEESEALGAAHDPVRLAARIEELKRNPTPEAITAARDEASIGAMMGPAGAVTKALQKLVNAPVNLPGLGPTRLFKFIDPFVTISSNILKEGLLKRTPIGFLSESIRNDLSGQNGNIAADMALSRMICGTMMAVSSVWLAAQGSMNGSGPVDRRLFNVWREAGNLPHSVRIGDIWYSVNRLGPLGLLMGVAADMHDVAHALEADEQGNRDYVHAGNLLQHAFTHNILDESFLRGPADLMKAIENPATEGEHWIKAMGTSFLPFSVGMAQIARAADPFSREARTFMDEVKARTPGMSEALWPRISIWGEPMPSYDAALHSGLTAIYESRANTDPVNLALLRLGIGIASLRPTVKGVQLNDQQYHDYATLAGRMLHERLSALVGSQVFQRSPGHMQHDLIVTVRNQTREAAQGWMAMRYPSILQQAHQQRLDIMTKEDAEAE